MGFSKKPKVLLASVIALIVLISIAAWYFQPWRLFTVTSVVESIPTTSALSSKEAIPPKASKSLGSDQDDLGVAAGEEEISQYPIVLAAGSLITHEHATTGSVRIVELETGERFLRLEGLNTSDGPQLEVWITDAPVIEGMDGWRVFDDGKFLSLGPLKGNRGDQNYEIPAGVDLSDFTSVSIWCVRFAVSFGAAELVGS